MSLEYAFDILPVVMQKAQLVSFSLHSQSQVHDIRLGCLAHFSHSDTVSDSDSDKVS